MEDKDNEIELKIDQNGGSIKLINQNNKVLAKIGDIIIDKLSFYRWNNALRFWDKYQEKKAQRKTRGAGSRIGSKTKR